MSLVRKHVRQKARRLVLDRQHMVAMLSDPEFYTACPHFLWLRDTAMTLHKQYLETPVNCNACKGDFNIVRPVVDAFFQNLRDLRDAGADDAIDNVKRYLETKKGYRVGEVVLYYRATRSQPHPQRFTF